MRDGRLSVYPDAELRQHVMNAVAIETPRGWRLAKEKSTRKIDGAVALSFACVGANAAGGSSRTWSISTLPEPRDQVVKRGDLVLRGSHYVRPPPRPPQVGAPLPLGGIVSIPLPHGNARGAAP